MTKISLLDPAAPAIGNEQIPIIQLIDPAADPADPASWQTVRMGVDELADAAAGGDAGPAIAAAIAAHEAEADPHPQYVTDDELAAALPELARDAIGAALTAGALISITVDDAGNVITIAVDAAAMDERARDTIAAALVAGPGVSITINDAGDTITVEQSGSHNPQTDSYALALADAYKLVSIEKATANNLTVPPNATVAFPVGTRIDIGQYGAGQTTIVAGSGVTIRSAGGKLKLTSQYSGATLQKIGADEWWLFGDLTS